VCSPSKSLLEGEGRPYNVVLTWILQTSHTSEFDWLTLMDIWKRNYTNTLVSLLYWMLWLVTSFFSSLLLFYNIQSVSHSFIHLFIYFLGREKKKIAYYFKCLLRTVQLKQPQVQINIFKTYFLWIILWVCL
jgi:hypothetical protein